MPVHRLKVVDPAVKWKVKRAKPYGGKRQALTQDELDRLFAALKGNRHGHRDYMVALVTFLHDARMIRRPCSYLPLILFSQRPSRSLPIEPWCA